MTVWVMHRLAMKLSTVFRRGLATGWKLAMVALAIVEMMIDVSVETIRPVIPGSGPDEDTAREPLRSIVPIRSASVRRSLIVPIRTNGRRSNADRNLSDRGVRGSHEEADSNSRKTQFSNGCHRFYL